MGPVCSAFDVVVVDDGVPVLEDRETITVMVTEVNLAPVADAGGDANVIVGQAVTLDGSGSVDLDVPVQTLSYSWSLSSVPAGSALTGPNNAATLRRRSHRMWPAISWSNSSSMTVLSIHRRPQSRSRLQRELGASYRRRQRRCGRYEHPAGVRGGGVRSLRELARRSDGGSSVHDQPERELHPQRLPLGHDRIEGGDCQGRHVDCDGDLMFGCARPFRSLPSAPRPCSSRP